MTVIFKCKNCGHMESIGTYCVSELEKCQCCAGKPTEPAKAETTDTKQTNETNQSAADPKSCGYSVQSGSHYEGFKEKLIKELKEVTDHRDILKARLTFAQDKDNFAKHEIAHLELTLRMYEKEIKTFSEACAPFQCGGRYSYLMNPGEQVSLGIGRLIIAFQDVVTKNEGLLKAVDKLEESNARIVATRQEHNKTLMAHNNALLKENQEARKAVAQSEECNAKVWADLRQQKEANKKLVAHNNDLLKESQEARAENEDLKTLVGRLTKLMNAGLKS